MRDLRSPAATALLLAPAVLWLGVAAFALLLASSRPGAFGPVVRPYSAVSGSESCASCHLSEYKSWHATFHRTMTQEVDRSEVAAPFHGETLTRGEHRAVMERDSEGRPTLTVYDRRRDEVVLRASVVLSVGSHRYQQYVGRIDSGRFATRPGELVRLPVAWHLGEARWIHMNDAFVEPQELDGDTEDWLRHLSTWNDNCVFCHNTQPVPGRGDAGDFTTRVGEYGIACESCHGPAKAHVARHQDPFRRVLSGWLVEEDDSITATGRLTSMRAADVCGRCHGQRIAADVGAVMQHGDGFVAGRDLSTCSRPIFRDSTLAGRPDIDFAPRFWPDGTPRLSAYEYQGLLMSPCVEGGTAHEGALSGPAAANPTDGDVLNCGSCHSMHNSDPAGQLRRDRRGDAACVGCHPAEELRGAREVSGHGSHRERAPGVSCVDCHMPRTTYGLLEGLVTHRITVPQPQSLLGRHDQPDACTQCHVDRSREWAAQVVEAWALPTSARGPRLALAKEVSERGEVSQVVHDLYGGDPLQRGLAADALGQPSATATAMVRAAWLVDGLVDDYASVRWMSWRALKRIVARERALAVESGRVEQAWSEGRLHLAETLLERFDPHGPADERARLRADLRAALGPGPLDHDTDALQALVAGRGEQALFIGE